MIKSGLTVLEALDISTDSLSGKPKKIVQSVKASVEAGQPLSASLAAYPNVFSQLFVNAVYAGETSGSLEVNLEHVAEQMRKEKELVDKIKGAMLYPIVILIATFALGMGISFFILPKITPLFQGLNIKLPITTRALISFANLVQAHGTLLFASIIACILILVWVSRQPFSRPVTHWFLLHFPIVKSISRNSNIARFCRTLSTLLKSGLTIIEAVNITRDAIGNYYYTHALDDVAGRLSSGIPLSRLLASHETYFPKLVTRMIAVGEESGQLEDSLSYLAGFFEEEVDNDAKTLSTGIEPILLIIIGIIVGFLALSIITPIYNITGNIGRQS